MHLYYYYPLPLHFRSGMTIQVLRDYSSLMNSFDEYSLSAFGFYENSEDFAAVHRFVNEAPFSFEGRKSSSRWVRNLSPFQH